MTLLVFAVVLYLTVTVKAQDCTALANAGNCDFYAQCVEPRFQCGTNGYPFAFGDSSCTHFIYKRSCFTTAVSFQCFLFYFIKFIQGQSWIENVKSCLMKAILNSTVYKSNGTCSQLQTFAFNSHQSCYTDNGFCTDILLNHTNFNCLAFEGFGLSDLCNERAIQQV